MLQRTSFSSNYKTIKTINSTNALTHKQLDLIVRTLLRF